MIARPVLSEPFENIALDVPSQDQRGLQILIDLYLSSLQVARCCPSQRRERQDGCPGDVSDLLQDGVPLRDSHRPG